MAVLVVGIICPLRQPRRSFPNSWPCLLSSGSHWGFVQRVTVVAKERDTAGLKAAVRFARAGAALRRNMVVCCVTGRVERAIVRGSSSLRFLDVKLSFACSLRLGFSGLRRTAGEAGMISMPEALSIRMEAE